MRIATFPHMGDYHVIFKSMLENMGIKVLVPPPMTKRTIALGSKHSPECACVPFKYNLGNYIESLEKGANVLVQAGGGCRFGFYAETQEKILKDLGYNFEFKKVFQGFSHTLSDLKSISPGLTNSKIIRILTLTYLKLGSFDKIDSIIRDNIAYEVEKGSFEKLKKEFLKDLEATNTIIGLHNLKKRTIKKLKQIKTKVPKTDLKVGLVGELYVVMEPFSNYFIEKKLAKMGIKVKRFVTVTSIINEAFNHQNRMRRYAKKGRPYIKYHVGAHGTESIVKTLQLINKGYDGIIHVKPFGCMPEVNAMSILHKISKDKKVPIIYFSFDEQTSETGINTRLEAFNDMLRMKKNA